MQSKIVGWLGTLLSAFAGGAATWGATQLEDAVPSSTAQWKAFSIGTAVAGAVAVANYLQKSPLDFKVIVPPPPPVPEVRL